MKLLLKTWNATNINSGSPFNAYILPGQLANLSTNPVLVARASDYPKISAVVKQPSQLIIQVIIAAGQNINTNRELLKQYFFGDENLHDLVAWDENDANKPYYRRGIAVRLVEENKAVNSFFVSIQTEYPYWQLVTAATDTWNITATGQTNAITNGGNLKIEPIYTITPTTTKTAGLKYRRYIPIYNNLDKSVSVPLDITSGGLNTAALVADTAISNQINEGGGITNSATTWAIDVAVGGGLPAGGGMFMMESEQCTYTSISGGTTISGVVRGVNGTTAATHADNIVMTLSHLQADGGDVRVWMDGSFIDYWLNGMNGATTKIWSNIPLDPRLEGITLGALLANTTTIAFAQTRANLAFLQALKTATNTTFLIESEAIVFAAANIDLLNYQITSCLRGQKDTTAATHVTASTARYIQHDLFLMYGDSTLTPSDVDDKKKPMFALTSTNAAWVYTSFVDTTKPDRPGTWRGEVRASRTKLSYFYTGVDNTFVDPSTHLGLALVSSSDFTVPHEQGTIDWLFTHPAGVTDVTYSGDKYCTGSWPGVVGLQYLKTSVAWFTAANHAIPAVELAWTPFGPSTVALAETSEMIRFVIEGVLSSVINERAMVQFDTVTCEFESANLPTIAVGAEAVINYFDFKLTNNTTGLYIKCQTPCVLNSALVIDCTEKKAYLSDGRQVPIILSTERDTWLDLQAGANTLQWDDVGTVAVTLVTSHKDKVL